MLPGPMLSSVSLWFPALSVWVFPLRPVSGPIPSGFCLSLLHWVSRVWQGVAVLGAAWGDVLLLSCLFSFLPAPLNCSGQGRGQEEGFCETQCTCPTWWTEVSAPVSHALVHQLLWLCPGLCLRHEQNSVCANTAPAASTTTSATNSLLISLLLLLPSFNYYCEIASTAPPTPTQF